MNYSLILGECIEVLSQLGESSIDSIVTDPPYGKEFSEGKDGVVLRKAEDAGGFQDGAGGNAYTRGRVYSGVGASSIEMMEWHQVWATAALRVLKPGGHMLAFGGPRTYHAMAMGVELAGFEIRDQILWLYGTGFPKSMDIEKALQRRGEETTGEYEGQGTALKPAHEPIVVARKPIKGTILDNVKMHNTGTLNIASAELQDDRWPANIIHDNSSSVRQYLNDASKYFYCAKPSKKERSLGLEERNDHPTIKPVSLMSHLCNLFTPARGLIVDPFVGSGTTGIAAMLNNFSFIGIDQELSYITTADDRIKSYKLYSRER